MALETTREIAAKIEGTEKRQKEEEEERRRRRKRTGNIYFIPTHPALKHLKQIFKKYAKYTKLKTLLIVTRKGGENIRQG